MVDDEQKLDEQSQTSSPNGNADLVGTTFAGRYEIERCIGQGGMGVVYLAKHTSLGRKVVIKTLINTVTDEGKRRFEREARQLSSLSHSNIVTLYDFGYEGDTAYIVMEYVEGYTLKELIHSGERMSAGTFFRLAIQVADAVGEAHSRGMLHRDLKPANIMLSQARGESALVKVLDFGLAKLKSSNMELTKEGNLVGSVSYVPPEHILGEETNMSADVYSLGVVFYYMLAGVKPFDGKDEMSVLYQHVHDQPPALSEAIDPSQQVPDSTVELIHECLSKKPEERPANADELLQRLLNEVNVASLHMPLASGEITRLAERKKNSRGRAMPGDRSRDSGLLTDDYVNTPTNLAANGIGSASKRFDIRFDGESSSISTSQILENSALLQVQVRRTRWLIGLMMLLLIGGGGAAILVLREEPDDTEQVVKQRIERLRLRLDDVENKLGDGDFGPAELILEGLKSELVDHPKLLERAADYRDQIVVGRLVRKGQRHTDAEEWAEAQKAYKKVLDVQPAHTEAQAKVDELGAKLAALDAAKVGTLDISSTPVAEVFIDDVLAGQTPLTQTLEPGSHVVELRASDHQPWTDQVTIDGNSTLRISPMLVPVESAPLKKSSRTRRPKRRAAPKPRRAKVTPKSKSSDQEAAAPSKPKRKRSSVERKASDSEGSLFGTSEASQASDDDLFEGNQQPAKGEFDLLEADQSNDGGEQNADFLD